MKRQILSLLGVTRQERHKITAEIRDAISAAGGWIADHSLFSNIAVTIRFSLPPQGLDELQRGIASAGVTLDDASLERLRQAVGNASDRNDEIDASMNITFIHDEPDLRREVPAIPG